MLVRLGLVKDTTFWVLKIALYGLRSAPRQWGEHRDQFVKALRLKVGSETLFLSSVPGSEVWQIMAVGGNKIPGKPGQRPEARRPLEELTRQTETPPSEEDVALCLLGVLRGFAIPSADDICLLAPHAIRDALATALSDKWSVKIEGKMDDYTPGRAPRGEDELRKIGSRVQRDKAGSYCFDQFPYIKTCLDALGLSTCRGTHTVPNLDHLPSRQEPDKTLPDLREAQREVGALLCLASRTRVTRPDLSLVCDCGHHGFHMP